MSTAMPAVSRGQAPLIVGLTGGIGLELVDPAGRLDRTRLRRLVFAEARARRRLEAILHPAVRRKMEQQALALRSPYLIFSVPLLIEAKQEDMVDRILVIDAPEEEQYRRVRQRSGLRDDEIAAILRSQCGREIRLTAADDVICNDSDLSRLHHAVEELHRKYLELAAKRG
jgi:dephospho-CoA kinase